MGSEISVPRIGMDIHRKFSRVTMRRPDNTVAWRRRVDHRDRAAMREQLDGWPKDAAVILEGTFGWSWMTDELLAAGLTPHLASSGKVAAWRKMRGLVKSDRTDADLLSELRMDEPWWRVWLAPPEVRQQREWLRYRMTLVRTQTQFKNRIHAILHRHGILTEQSDLFGRDGRRFLGLLAVSADSPLPDSGRATLVGYLRMLDHLRRQIADVTRQFRRQVRTSPTAMRLRTLPGIDWILSYTILSEIGRIERFRGAKHLASYSLLAPRANESAVEDPKDPPLGRHVGHAGRRTLKWAFIEAAHGAVRRGGRFREQFDRRTDGGRRDRNRGYIAVARTLSRIVYVCWSKEVDFSENPPARPGRRRGRRSRPELGQPDRPMVAVVD